MAVGGRNGWTEVDLGASRRGTAALSRSNDTVFGLAAYFYARDLSRVTQVAVALEYGMVGSNTGLISTEVAPFGGAKQSGLGREGSRHGMDEFMQAQRLPSSCFGCVAPPTARLGSGRARGTERSFRVVGTRRCTAVAFALLLLIMLVTILAISPPHLGLAMA